MFIRPFKWSMSVVFSLENDGRLTDNPSSNTASRFRDSGVRRAHRNSTSADNTKTDSVTPFSKKVEHNCTGYDANSKIVTTYIDPLTIERPYDWFDTKNKVNRLPPRVVYSPEVWAFMFEHDNGIDVIITYEDDFTHTERSCEPRDIPYLLSSWNVTRQIRVTSENYGRVSDIDVGTYLKLYGSNVSISSVDELFEYARQYEIVSEIEELCNLCRMSFESLVRSTTRQVVNSLTHLPSSSDRGLLKPVLVENADVGSADVENADVETDAVCDIDTVHVDVEYQMDAESKHVCHTIVGKVAARSFATYDTGPLLLALVAKFSPELAAYCLFLPTRLTYSILFSKCLPKSARETFVEILRGIDERTHILGFDGATLLIDSSSGIVYSEPLVELTNTLPI